MEKRTFDEFWSLSPAQVHFTIDVLSRKTSKRKRKGTTSDLLGMFEGNVKQVMGPPPGKPGRY